MLENVCGLLTGGQHLLVISMIKNCGYFAFVVELNPLQFGLPQSRPRLWFLCIRDDVVEEAGVTEAGLAHMLSGILDSLLGGYGKLNLGSVLSRPSDEDVVSQHIADLEKARASRRASAGRAKGGDMKWAAKRNAIGWQSSSSSWDPSLSERFPAFVNLPERGRQLLE